MEELLKKMADLITAAEELGIVSPGLHYILTPEGSRIETEDQELIYANN